MQMFASEHEHFVSEYKVFQENAKDLQMNTKFLGEMQKICKWTQSLLGERQTQELQVLWKITQTFPGKLKHFVTQKICLKQS